MKIVIVEDESRSAIRLERLVRNEFEKDKLNLFVCKSIDSALDLLENTNIDLLFLDLNLHGEDGFEILNQVVSQSFHTIVVSAYAERAIEAFEYGVLDFVPKPIMDSRLQVALDRFKFEQRSSNETKFLTVKKGSVIEKISVNDIIYLQAQDHYTELHIQDKPVQLHDKSLEKLLMILPTQFERSHRSYIVNMDFVSCVHSFVGSRYKLELTNNSKLPLARSHAKEIKEKLRNYGRN